VTFTTYKAKEQGPSAWEAANFSEPTRLSMIAVKRSVFQGLASMALPAFTIHTAVAQTAKAVKNSQNLVVKRWLPSAVGIGIVPFLPYLFDHPVEYATDVLFDKVEEAMAKSGTARPAEPKPEL
jgi:fission process protein 1